MALTLAQYRTRVLELLDDVSSNRYTTAQVDAGLRAALAEYSIYRPQQLMIETYLSQAVKKMLLDDFEDELPKSITSVRYTDPAHEEAYQTKWSPSNFNGLWYLTANAIPPANKELEVYYETWQTIASLDGGTTSTVPTQDNDLLCKGAAGYAARTRAVSRLESVNVEGDVAETLMKLSDAYLMDFRSTLRRQQFPTPAFAHWQYP